MFTPLLTATFCRMTSELRANQEGKPLRLAGWWVRAHRGSKLGGSWPMSPPLGDVRGEMRSAHSCLLPHLTLHLPHAAEMNLGLDVRASLYIPAESCEIISRPFSKIGLNIYLHKAVLAGWDLCVCVCVCCFTVSDQVFKAPNVFSFSASKGIKGLGTAR